MLTSIDYSENDQTPAAWHVGPLLFGPINLIVGRNATGKTRVLNVVREFAQLLQGQSPTEPATRWEARFSGETESVYQVALKDGTVTSESYRLGDRELLRRSADGSGSIHAEQLQQSMDIGIPQELLAAVARRDFRQHPFLEPLHQWARSVHHFSFSSTPRPGKFATGSPSAPEPQPESGLAQTFRAGLRQFGADFEKEVLAESGKLCSCVEAIDVREEQGSERLFVKETRLRTATSETAMSQGMLRCLNLTVHLQLLGKLHPGACVLIDDVGEGLDFDRSSNVVDWLLAKAREFQFQLIFSTNDRIVMNKVPLEHWTILKQEAAETHVYNYANSKRLFDDFRFTGLNNFDFFSMDFAEADDE